MLDRKRAVVAMTDPSARAAVFRALQERGIEIKLAFNAHEARILVENGSADFLVTDPEIDGGRGLDLVQCARSTASRKGMMIVVVAAHGATLIKPRAERSGADAVVRDGSEVGKLLSA